MVKEMEEKKKRKIYDSERRASARYDSKNTIQIKLKLNINTDSDILAKLESVENKQGYIKQLIREDLTK